MARTSELQPVFSPVNLHTCNKPNASRTSQSMHKVSVQQEIQLSQLGFIILVQDLISGNSSALGFWITMVTTSVCFHALLLSIKLFKNIISLNSVPVICNLETKELAWKILIVSKSTPSPNTVRTICIFF